MNSSDKDTPSTWRKYHKSLCHSCQATCCTMPVEVRLEDLVRLGYTTPEDFLSSLKKSVQSLKKQGLIKSYREKTGLFMLEQKANGDCIFLDSKTRQCTIYEKRPQTCRDFPARIGRKPGYCPYNKK